MPEKLRQATVVILITKSAQRLHKQVITDLIKPLSHSNISGAVGQKHFFLLSNKEVDSGHSCFFVRRRRQAGVTS